MATVFHSDSSTAREMIAGGDGIVLVDFTAAWCPPCRTLEPVIDQLAAETRDLTVVKVDVDESPDLAVTYEVMSMPTLLFFRDGQVVDRVVGALPPAQLRAKVNELRRVTASPRP